MAKPGEHVPSAVLLALLHPADLPGQRGQQIAHRCTPTTNAHVKTKSTNLRLRLTFWETRNPILPEGKTQSEIGRFGLDVRVGGTPQPLNPNPRPPTRTLKQITI